MSDRSGARAAVRLLRELETRLAALDEGLLLATAFCVLPPPGLAAPPGLASPPAAEPPPRRPRLGFARAEAVQAEPPAQRLRFTAAGEDVDRLVIQNWNPHPGYVALGEAELELDPGQAVTLLISRSSPTPSSRAARADAAGEVVILAPEETLLV